MDSEHTRTLKLALKNYRRGTKWDHRLLMYTAIAISIVVIAVIVRALFRNEFLTCVLGSPSTLGLLTFARAIYLRHMACEFDCAMLEVELACGGFEAFKKALPAVTCNKISALPAVKAARKASNGND